MIYVQRRRGQRAQMGSVGSLLKKAGAAGVAAGKRVASDAVTGAGASLGNRVRALVSATGATAPAYQDTSPRTSYTPLILGGLALAGGAFLLLRKG